MKKIIFILLSAFAFTACNDTFLETVNHNNLDSESFFKTENDLQLALNSAYTPLQHNGMFGLQYQLVMNTLDPYIWFEGMSSFDIMNFGPATGNIKTMWGELYIGLFRTSDILANMNKVKDIVPAEKYAQTEGQLRALRGMYYFYLVSLFDKAIYYDETNVPKNPLIGLENGTQEQFWNKLEEDLTFATTNLPDKWESADVGRITKDGATAQLGKALLYKHYHYYLRFNKGNTPEAKANLQKAKSALKAAMNGTHALTMPLSMTKEDIQAALLSNFSFIDIPVGSNSYKSENNNESLWEVQYNENPGTNVYLPGFLSGGNMNYWYFSPSTNSYRNQVIDPELWNEFESVSSHPAGYTKDPRAYATCYIDGDLMDWRTESGYKTGYDGSVNGKSGLFTSVYKDFTLTKAIGLKKYYYPQHVTGSTPAVSPNNVRVIRLSDVMLMYAEACYQVDADADGSGLKALNDVRERVKMPLIAALTPAAIIHERNVELATEGLRYNDIIRWSYDANFGIDLTTLFKGNFNTNKNYYFPIPQSEIDANNGALKQNKGW